MNRGRGRGGNRAHQNGDEQSDSEDGFTQEEVDFMDEMVAKYKDQLSSLVTVI